MIAYHQLYHARKLVKNVKKKWETKKTPSDEVLSPSKVQRGMGDLLKQLPAITAEVKPRGRPSGNQMGAEIITRPDCEVVKKSASKPKENKGFSINYRFEKDSNILKPSIKYHGLKKEQIPDDISKIISQLSVFESLAPTQPP